MNFARRILASTFSELGNSNRPTAEPFTPAHVLYHPQGAPGWLTASPWEGLYLENN